MKSEKFSTHTKLKFPIFREGVVVAIGDNHVVEQFDIHRRARSFHVLRKTDVLLAGATRARRMVVYQNHGSRLS